MILFSAFRLRLALCALFFLAVAPASGSGMADHPDTRAFIYEMVERHGMDDAALIRLFDGRLPNADVLKLIAPPASPGQRSWRRYRSRFLDSVRIRGGVAFWQRNAAVLEQARALYGVPEEIIVAIIGVETVYGLETGRFNTLEALATLAFHYPPRARFFRQELEQLLLLARENHRPADSYRGSYAGALGIPQFMPGSLRRYAVDFDGDGRIDLRESEADAIGSVASFLNQHGWLPDAPIAVSAKLSAPPDPRWLEADILPTLTARELLASGVAADVNPEETVTLIELATPDLPPEYWLGHGNFYVLTRYNRSSFYAMSVHQLAEAVREAKRSTGVPRVGADALHRRER